jgi:hypothetical protein
MAVLCVDQCPLCIAEGCCWGSRRLLQRRSWGLRLTNNGRRLLSLATLLDAKYDSVHLNAKYPQLGVAEAPISVSLRRPYRSAACALRTLRPTGQPISARPWKRG